MNKVFIGSSGDLEQNIHQGLDYCSYKPNYNEIILKPNLVQPFQSGSGNITNVRVVRTLIDCLLERYSIKKIIIAESSSLTYDTVKAFKSSRLIELEGYHQIVQLIDLRQESYYINGNTLGKPRILDGKSLINIPVLKAHPQVTLTCCLKNLKGLCHDKDKKNIHFQGLNEHLRQLDQFRPELNVVDATRSRYSFDLDAVAIFDRILVGQDPIHVDIVAGKMVGLECEKIPYLADLVKERKNIQKTNTSIPLLDKWQPFVAKVSFPGADIYLGDSCNFCLEHAIKASGSPFKPGHLIGEIYKTLFLISKIVSQKLGFSQDVMSSSKPIIVLGRLDPWIFLPKDRQIVYVGTCASQHENINGRQISGCPPEAITIFSELKKRVNSC